jgi:hypothetical protein
VGPKNRNFPSKNPRSGSPMELLCSLVRPDAKSNTFAHAGTYSVLNMRCQMSLPFAIKVESPGCAPKLQLANYGNTATTRRGALCRLIKAARYTSESNNKLDPARADYYSIRPRSHTYTFSPVSADRVSLYARCCFARVSSE